MRKEREEGGGEWGERMMVRFRRGTDREIAASIECNYKEEEGWTEHRIPLSRWSNHGQGTERKTQESGKEWKNDGTPNAQLLSLSLSQVDHQLRDEYLVRMSRQESEGRMNEGPP